jgi:hypothetical protein
MKLNIIFENKKCISDDINIFSSINSFIYGFTNDNHEDYFLEYNGILLDKNLSFSKYITEYNIDESSYFTLSRKIRGGVSSSDLGKNPFFIGICILIILVPLFILPMGFIPALSNFIKVILDKSFSSICRYLACDLGKKTLVSRIKFIIWIIKIVIFALMIYVTLTLPLSILCMTLKGKSIFDNPKALCKPYETGTLAGTILTVLYIMIYLCFRAGTYILNPLISISNKFYITNITITPILNFLLNIYNNNKYFPMFFVPFITPYFLFLGKFMEAVQMVFSALADIGCKGGFDKFNNFGKEMEKKFTKVMEDKLKKCGVKCGESNNSEPKINVNKTESNNSEKKVNKKEDDDKNKSKFEDDICAQMPSECCNSKALFSIASWIEKLFENSFTLTKIEENGLYTQLILFAKALYSRSCDAKKDEIDLDDEIKNKDEAKAEEDSKLKDRLDSIRKLMEAYAKEKGFYYDEDKYKMTDNLFKNLFLNSFCNIVSTANSSGAVIKEMGEITEVVDMLKAGTSTGIMMAFVYFLTVVIIAVMSFFGMS